ncbi:AmmeMemoRadiSam system protein B [Roseibium alexandrii]
MQTVIHAAIITLLFHMPSASTAQDQSALKFRIDAALRKEKPATMPPDSVTGIIVPHHLLAPDLIARGVWAASGRSVKRIILMAPDHFRLSPERFSTSRHPFAPTYAPLYVANSAIDHLLQHDDLVHQVETLDHEHGLTAVVPFLEHVFPDAELMPLIAGNATTPLQWQQMAGILKPLLDQDTLLVLSADFSHYLPLSQAVLRDQESLSIIAGRDPAHVADLVQPAHTDTKAALAIQLELQKEFFDSSPTILANRSSVDYGGPDDNTTTYITAAFVSKPSDGSALEYADQSILYFGGDVFLGRYLTRLLRQTDARLGGFQTIFEGTRGRPLIINLEGTLLEEQVFGVPENAHVMALEIARPALHDLNVQAASVANNHSFDLGQDGYRASLNTLKDIGITAIEAGKPADIGPIRALGLNFIRGRYIGKEKATSYSPETIKDLVCEMAAAPPLIAFVHWGQEFTRKMTERETAIANVLVSCGVSLVVGAHSHQASTDLVPIQGGRGLAVFSLGNLVFDQRPHWADGSLLELRTFQNGTIAARLIPVSNVFEGMEAASGKYRSKVVSD